MLEMAEVVVLMRVNMISYLFKTNAVNKVR